MPKVIRQNWEESERDWGQRPDGYSLHLSSEHRQSFIESYWATMPDAVPDEYSRPDGDPVEVEVDDETYAQVKESTTGVRVY